MSDLLFSNISDFIKCRELCFFCGVPLRCRLSNFIGFNETPNIPLLNSYPKEDKFTFNISHTTPDFNIKAHGFIDLKTNLLYIEPEQSNTPKTDTHVALDTFIDLRPYIQLYCPKLQCLQKYTVASDFLRAEVHLHWRDNERFIILPPRLYYESFTNGNLIVQNDYIHSCTNIFSRTKEDAGPIVVPLMDVKAMGARKILLRTKTISVFS